MTEPAAQPLAIPSIRWQAETAVLTSPLEQEIEDLQSDLKKAEEAVRRDIERLF
jgi:predicted ATP-grasp superfamily ATP-dependent carboligase